MSLDWSRVADAIMAALTLILPGVIGIGHLRRTLSGKPDRRRLLLVRMLTAGVIVVLLAVTALSVWSSVVAQTAYVIGYAMTWWLAIRWLRAPGRKREGYRRMLLWGGQVAATLWLAMGLWVTLVSGEATVRMAHWAKSHYRQCTIRTTIAAWGPFEELHLPPGFAIEEDKGREIELFRLEPEAIGTRVFLVQTESAARPDKFEEMINGQDAWESVAFGEPGQGEFSGRLLWNTPGAKTEESEVSVIVIHVPSGLKVFVMGPYKTWLKVMTALEMAKYRH